MLERIVAKLLKFELTACAVLLLLMSVLALTQVITRYVFFYSIVWMEELTRYCMILMTFLGASVAVHKEDNIAIDIVPMLLRDKRNLSITPFLHVVIFCFSCSAVYYAVGLTLQTVEYGQATPAMRIPMGIVYGAMALCYVLMMVHAAIRIVLYCRRTTTSAVEQGGGQ